MPVCPSCESDQPTSAAYCSACGAALRGDPQATLTHSGIPGSSETAGLSSGSQSSHHGRFLPGTKIADRYRIVSLVGRGGMGEVYRADDLKLGHTVALKFLPQHLAEDPQRLEYFYSEVRLTRQISHPNVCRVFDIDEVDQQHFLSMEYIDGEDLKVLLRRIGRLPKDKGIQIAQQLCLGLAAAHGQGVLHRDLKPANIMIDGRGQVRITDFGLAKLIEEDVAGEFAGTPAYMAPEQLSRGEVTIQSDLYSLGLIFYELFTGSPARSAQSVKELLQADSQVSFSHPSDLVDDMDPTVERVILRCLQSKPEDRPRSANAVASALPGGDPLAAALAAGETPTPEMVAAAGGTGWLSLPVGILLWMTTILFLVGIPVIANWRDDFQLREISQKPDVFEANSKQLISDLGYDLSDTYSMHGFQLSHNKEYLEFWYRSSPQPMVPELPMLTRRPLAWRTSATTPKPNQPGMVNLSMAPNGNLVEFRAVSSPVTSHPGAPESWQNVLSNWTPFDASELTSTAADSASTIYPLPVAATELWTSPHQPMIVGTWNGHLVYFRDLSSVSPKPSNVTVRPWVLRSVQILLIFLSAGLTLRHLKTGRADTVAALRCSVYYFAIDMILWVIGIRHDGSRERELDFALNYLVRSLGYALRIWLYYLALEPLARRFFPDMLISWSRLLAGRFQNGLVGRDILLGCLWGAVITFLEIVIRCDWIAFMRPDFAMGGTLTAAQVLDGQQAGIASGLYYLTFLLLLRLLFRNNLLSLIAFTGFLAIATGQNWHVPGQAIMNFVYFLTLAAMYLRFGLLSPMVGVFTWHTLILSPYGAPSAWYSQSGTFAIVTFTALATFGFYTSTIAGRSLDLANSANNHQR